MPDSSSILERIRAENLAVYEASPSRLKEDVNGEDEVAGNYRGRLVHELSWEGRVMAHGVAP